jgi:hypothetical protein
VRPGRDADPSTPSSSAVKNRVPLLSLKVFVAYERVKLTYLTLYRQIIHTKHTHYVCKTLNIFSVKLGGTYSTTEPSRINLYLCVTRYFLGRLTANFHVNLSGFSASVISVLFRACHG